MKIYNSNLNNFNEIWKVIKDFPDYYVSNLGRIKSAKFKKEKILRQSINRRGYLKVSLSRNNKQKTKEIHKLVFESFNLKLKLDECIHHVDGNKLNNRLDNLLKINKLEHYKYHSSGRNNPFYGRKHTKDSKNKISEIRKSKFKSGEIKKLNQKGENNNNSKLNIKKVIQIKMLFKLGLRNCEIYNLYKVSSNTISNIRTGRIWKYVEI